MCAACRLLASVYCNFVPGALASLSFQATLLTDSQASGDEGASCLDDPDEAIEQPSTESPLTELSHATTEVESPPPPRKNSVSSTGSESSDETDSEVSGCGQERELEELGKLNKIHRPFRDELSVISSDKGNLYSWLLFSKYRIPYCRRVVILAFSDFFRFYGTHFGDSHQINQIQHNIVRNVDKMFY